MNPQVKTVLVNKLLRLVQASRIMREQMDAFWCKRVLQKAPPSYLTHCLPESDDPEVDAVEAAARHVERELELLRKEDEEEVAATGSAGGSS